MSLTKEGHSAIFSTTGNDDCHIILRGGKKPNYDSESVQRAAEQLEKSGLRPNLMVDCSHANSNKDYKRQVDVCHDVAKQISNGDNRIMGIWWKVVRISWSVRNSPTARASPTPVSLGKPPRPCCRNWPTLLKRGVKSKNKAHVARIRKYTGSV
jgi:hypothetical protein